VSSRHGSASRTEAKRIFVVEDHPIVRHGYRTLLELAPDLKVVGEASTAEEAISALESAPVPDLLVVDLGLSGMSGLELIRKATDADAGIRVLVVSMYEEALYGEKALQSGAHGYVRKKKVETVIVEAARTVLEGDYYLSAPLQRRIVGQYTGQGETTGGAIQSLTDRELEVFEKIGLGLSTREVADRLHISMKTVQTHRRSIQEKLGIDTIEKLMRKAVLWTDQKSR
jgi:DNA-binding NarL/FixJ family response regulator